MNNTPEMRKPSVWGMQVRAPFKKVIAFDLLFLGLGTMIGAGILAAILHL
ncbi:MAG: hypothetical protein KGH89_04290 [Thaumarchaeota archaeon]|nr:hypothetical protein [Nitrososphaerota archaeon]